MPLLISEIISNKNGQQRSAGRFFTPNNGKIFCKDGNERFMRDVRACIEMNKTMIFKEHKYETRDY
jgi:hypothetical protein